MFRVVILQKSLPQYRKAFFDRLRETLAASDVQLDLVYGNVEEGTRDKISLDWAEYRENKFYKLGPLQLIWQPALNEIKGADLVIVEQAEKLLLNYKLYWMRFRGKQSLAFWGPGRDMQAGKYSIKNFFKRLFLRSCDWWFAYTPGGKAFLEKNGFSADKITVVRNALDTRQMKDDYESVTEAEIEALKSTYKIHPEEHVMIYCGAIYKEKRIDFLIEAADELFNRGFRIRLFIVGGGSDEAVVREAVKTRDYITWTGPLFGREKAKIFRLSELFLIPGAIGLAVIDSFVFKTPVVTTDYPYHGAEFEYLISGSNGLVTENSLQAYTDGIASLLSDRSKVNDFTLQCAADAETYTNENMVSNYAKGILQFLSQKGQLIK